MVRKLSFPACILGALMLLVLPLRWMLAWAVAAALHELGHLVAVCLLGGRVLEIRAGARGMVMETVPMKPWQTILATAAGPGVSLSLVLLCRWMPRTALCGLAQGLYNLLPIYPLDGGRIVRCLFRRV